MNLIRKGIFCYAICCAWLLSVPQVSHAQLSEMQALKALVENMQQTLQKALSRIDQLEKEKAANAVKIEQEKMATTARLGDVEKSVQAVKSAAGALNPGIGMVLDASIDQRARKGGNFNFRSAEIGLAASVDPFARMYGFINGTPEGVEVDEAAAITTSLPWNLTAKAGPWPCAT